MMRQTAGEKSLSERGFKTVQSLTSTLDFNTLRSYKDDCDMLRQFCTDRRPAFQHIRESIRIYLRAIKKERTDEIFHRSCKATEACPSDGID
jgi:site-specific recombinase XerD